MYTAIAKHAREMKPEERDLTVRIVCRDDRYSAEIVMRDGRLVQPRTIAADWGGTGDRKLAELDRDEAIRKLTERGYGARRG